MANISDASGIIILKGDWTHEAVDAFQQVLDMWEFHGYGLGASAIDPADLTAAFSGCGCWNFSGTLEKFDDWTRDWLNDPPKSPTRALTAEQYDAFLQLMEKKDLSIILHYEDEGEEGFHLYEKGEFWSSGGRLHYRLNKSTNIKNIKDHLIISRKGKLTQYIDRKCEENIVIADGVTSIGDEVFEDCRSITSITIPEGVETIGHRAFSGCTGLRSVIIPSSVKTIDDYAFSGCTSLTSITIPEGTKKIGYCAFADCTDLQSVIIPDSVKNINDEVFCGCKNLADDEGFVIVRGIIFDYLGVGGDVVIPDGVTEISRCAFSGCKRLTSITIPGSVKKIGAYAFANCKKLSGVELAKSVKTIGVGAFANCKSLAADAEGFAIVRDVLYNYVGAGGDVVIPDGVKTIEDGTFSGCKSLTGITLPNSVKKIGMDAFKGCSVLRNVTLSDGVENIGSGAFSGCKSLENINIPQSLKITGFNMFKGCSKLIVHAPAGNIAEWIAKVEKIPVVTE